jgi:hypothetical protein
MYGSAETYVEYSFISLLVLNCARCEQLNKEENNSTGMAAEATTIMGQTGTHDDSDDRSSKTPSVTSQVPKALETTISSLPLVPPQYCVSPTHPPSHHVIHLP